MTNGHFHGCVDQTDCWCEVKRYWLILSVAFSILVVELIGAYVSGSLALLADAFHVLADNAAIIVSIIVAYLVKFGRPESRIRKIGLYVNVALLWIIVVVIFKEAIDRIENPNEIMSIVMISIATVGAIGNWIQHKILRQVADDHHHETHQALSLHVISDLLLSIGVIIGGIAILVTDIVTIDPILSMLIALWIFYQTIKLLRNPTGQHNHHH